MSNLNNVPDGLKIIIDTNIFLYTILDHPGYQKECTEFLTCIERGNVFGYIPSIVVQELSHHIIMSELIERGHGKRVSDCISMFKRDSSIIDEVHKSWDVINGIFEINCSILYENEEILKSALIISKKYRLLINDAYIVAFTQSYQIKHLA